MLDINLIREQPDMVRRSLEVRQLETTPVDQVLELDKARRELIQEVEVLKAERNILSKEISRTKDAEERQGMIESSRGIGARIEELDNELRGVEGSLNELMASIPNIPDKRTPYGIDESENVVIKTVGEVPQLDFEPQPHWDSGPALGVINFEQGVKITGSRFYVLNGAGARLQRALIAWMLDVHIQQGYTEKYTPFMVKAAVLYGSGHLPKFAHNLYKDHEEDLWMVPTAEVPLTGIHMDEILDEEALPLHYTAYTPCFRREKMSAGEMCAGSSAVTSLIKSRCTNSANPRNRGTSLKRWWPMLSRFAANWD